MPWSTPPATSVQFRGAWYGFGAIALLIAWIIFMVRILLGLP